MISVSEMQKLEKEAEKNGISTLQLMENAGANCAKILDEEVSLKGKSILVFCGTGNNGGDGFCFARHAKILGAEVSVFLVKKSGDIRTIDARRNFDILKNYGFEIFEENMPEDLLQKADIIVDAFLGTGAMGAPKEPYKSVIEKITRSCAFKMSIDVPSGIDADTGEISGIAVRPEITICLHDAKSGLNEKTCGKMRVASIGIPGKQSKNPSEKP